MKCVYCENEKLMYASKLRKELNKLPFMQFITYNLNNERCIFALIRYYTTQ